MRRPTGGRAVWHHHEVTYSVCASEAEFGCLRDAYHEIHAMLAQALQHLGAAVALLLWLPRLIKRIPVPLIALVVSAVLVVLIGHLVPADWGFNVTTIGSKFIGWEPESIANPV